MLQQSGKVFEWHLRACRKDVRHKVCNFRHVEELLLSFRKWKYSNSLRARLNRVWLMILICSIRKKSFKKIWDWNKLNMWGSLYHSPRRFPGVTMNFRSEVPGVLCLRWFHIHSKSSSIKYLLENELGQYSEHKYSSLLVT